MTENTQIACEVVYCTRVTMHSGTMYSHRQLYGREVQKIVSHSIPTSHSSTYTDGPGTLPITLRNLMTASLAPSSHRFYDKVWNSLILFCNSALHHPVKLPVTYATVALYVAYLYEKGFSASTVTSHLSAIAYFHNISGHNDPTKCFVVRKTITGLSRLTPQYDTRLPITEPILQKLVNSLQFICPSHYEQLLYKSIFTLAFYGLARVGELVSTSPEKLGNVLQVTDINIIYHSSIPSSLQVFFRHFKHNISTKVHTITLNKLSKPTICPLQAILDYLPKRGPQLGCLFLDHKRQPLVRKTFDSLVRRCLKFCDLDSSYYKGHSFRIEGATLAANKGMSDAQIRLLGRWKSDAFRKYIRAQPLQGNLL